MKRERTDSAHLLNSITGFVVVAGVVLSCVIPGNAAAGDEVTVDGVLHVRNGAAPARGMETLSLKELWRAGGEDDEVFFGIITQVRLDDSGNIYLLDTQLSEVQVYAPDGEHLRTLSRQGEGPGESNNPSDMLFMPDGSLGLVQTFPGKIVKIDLEGNPAGTFTIGGSDPTAGGFAAMIDVQQGGDNLVVGGLRIAVNQAERTQTRKHFVAAFDAEGEEKVRYEEHELLWDFNNFTLDEKEQYFPHFRRWTVGPDGRVYTAPERNQYAIHVHRPDGTLERVIEREYQSWQRDEKFMRRVDAVMEAQKARFPFEIKTSVEDTEPDIAGMHVDGDGSLWVRTSRSGSDAPEGAFLIYDVFDAQGHYDRRVAIECEGCAGHGNDDGLFFAREGRIIRVTRFVDALVSLQGAVGIGEDEEDAVPMEVICYAVAARS